MMTYLLFVILFVLTIIGGYFVEKSVKFQRPTSYYIQCAFLGIMVYPSIPIAYFVLGELPGFLVVTYLIVTGMLGVTVGIIIYKSRHYREYSVNIDKTMPDKKDSEESHGLALRE